MEKIEEKIESYINNSGFEGKKIADVLREYAQGKELGDIVSFYDYSIDKTDLF